MKETLLQLWKNFKSVLILGIICVCLSLVCLSSIRSCMSYKEQADNNIVALKDSIHYHKTKYNELYVSKQILIGNMNTLKVAYDSLYNTLKDMNIKDPSSVVYVNTVIEHVKHDTIWNVNNDSSIVYPNLYKEFNFTDKYRELSGNVYLNNSQLGLNIEKDNIFADFTIAVENNKVFIKSNNPYVKYNDIKGLTLPSYNRKTTLVIGPSISWGYDFGNKNFSPTIGISATYGLDVIRLFKK